MMSDDLRHNYLKRRELQERSGPVVPVLDLRAAFLACFGEAA